MPKRGVSSTRDDANTRRTMVVAHLTGAEEEAGGDGVSSRKTGHERVRGVWTLIEVVESGLNRREGERSGWNLEGNS